MRTRADCRQGMAKDDPELLEALIIMAFAGGGDYEC
eukprot:gene25292-4628_t